MKTSLIKRLALILLLLELGYLAVFNLALYLPLTQTLINQIKPDKFHVSWEQAWTPWPFRVYASGITANGQTRTQQWELNTPDAQASISLWPLLLKRVDLHGVIASDVRYYQRPRPRADKDYSDVRKYFPPIQGRALETQPPQLASPKAGAKPWHISLRDMHAQGKHAIWLSRLQAALEGDVAADLSVVTRGGPFSLSNSSLDIGLTSLTLDGNQPVARDGRIKGQLALKPFKIKENKGLKSLAFLEFDLDVFTRTRSLAFLNTYLQAFQGMQVDGAGTIDGKIAFASNRLLEDTDLEISADELSLEILDYRVIGDGDIRIQVPPSTHETHFAIAFNDLDAYQGEQVNPLLTGSGLAISGVGSDLVIPTETAIPDAHLFALTVASLEAPDLYLFQALMPDKWAMKLVGGTGKLAGQISLGRNQLDADFQLSSDAAELGFNDYEFSSNLDLRLKTVSSDLGAGEIDVSGTHIKINETQLEKEQQASTPWHAAVDIEQGLINLKISNPETSQITRIQHLVKTLREQGISGLLANADEDLKVKGDISDLDWLNLLIDNPYGLKIHGQGSLTSDIRVRSGWLDKGSRLSLIPQSVSVEVLDYLTEGRGTAEIKVTRGGQQPDIRLDIAIDDAKFRRQSEQQAFIEDVSIELQSVIPEFQLQSPGQNMSLQLRIPSARITDMSAYNSYLPAQSPLLILDGEAALEADIHLKPEHANGYIRLKTRDMQARIDEQDISARLSADITLTGGTPRNMEFDITGSTLSLDQVQVLGEEKTYMDENWRTDIHFTRAKTTWKKPLQLDIEADLKMSDSIPVVSMLANHRGKHGWLENALTIDDVEGDFLLQLADEIITIPYAFVSSDNIDVGAKALIDKESRNGVIFVRYKALKGLLKIKQGKRNLDVLKAKEKFDSYSPATPDPALDIAE